MSNINVNSITPLSGVTGTVSVSGSLLVSGSITANGNIILGDSTADSVSLGAEVSSSIIPDANNTYNLGSSAKKWSEVHAQSGSLNYLNVASTLIVNSLTVTGSNTITNWGNFKNRFPTNDRYFTVTTNPTVAGGWKNGISVPGNTTGSAPHLHFQLSGSGVAGIGLLNPEHTLHISSSGAGKALYVDGTAAFPGNISSSLTPLANAHTGFNVGSTTKIWNNMYASQSNVFQINPINVRALGFAATNLADRRFVQMSGSFIPYADDKFDLGAQYYKWRDIFIDGTAYIDTINNINTTHVTASSNISASGTIYGNVVIAPGGITSTNGTGYFANIISTGNSTLATTTITTASIGRLQVTGCVSGSLIPCDNNTWDLGSTSKIWANSYASASYVKTIYPISAAGTQAFLHGVSRPFVKISGSFVPTTNDQFDLGHDHYQWRNLHINGVANIDTLGNNHQGGGAIVNVSASLIPTNNQEITLGSTSKIWTNSYVSSSYLGVIKSFDRGAGVNNDTNYRNYVESSASIYPTADAQFDLGRKFYEWRHLYIDGTAHIDQLANFDNDIINSSASLNPTADNTYDLGSTSKEWKDIYVDGTAYIDTVQAGGLTGDAGTVNIFGQATASLYTSASLTEVRFDNLPTSPSLVTGSLWVSGSSIAHPGSGYLMVVTG